MRITYRDRTLSIRQISEFTAALKIAAKEFFNKLDRQSNMETNELLEVIRDFVNTATSPVIF